MLKLPRPLGVNVNVVAPEASKLSTGVWATPLTLIVTLGVGELGLCAPGVWLPGAAAIALTLTTTSWP